MHWELDEVERPFVEQLSAMGWCYVAGDLDQPAKTGRASFAEVVQEATLRRQLYALNLRNVAGVAQPWLDNERLLQAVGAITRIPAHGLMVANRVATELLPGGITVDGMPGWDGGQSRPFTISIGLVGAHQPVGRRAQVTRAAHQRHHVGLAFGHVNQPCTRKRRGISATRS